MTNGVVFRNPITVVVQAIADFGRTRIDACAVVVAVALNGDIAGQGLANLAVFAAPESIAIIVKVISRTDGQAGA